MSIGRWVFWLGGAVVTAAAIELAARGNAGPNPAQTLQQRPLPADWPGNARVGYVLRAQLDGMGFDASGPMPSGSSTTALANAMGGFARQTGMDASTTAHAARGEASAALIGAIDDAYRDAKGLPRAATAIA